MKLPALVLTLLLGASAAQADQRCYKPARVTCAQPVVYQTQVVYNAPVVYQSSPVYYHGANQAYNQVVYTGACQSPNVIIAGRGAYYTSYHTSPTVITIGGGHASRGLLPNRRCR